MAQQYSDIEHSFQIDSSAKMIVLITLSIVSFLLSFMMQAFTVALPTIGKEFHVNAVLLNWIVSSYVLLVAAFSVPFGRIADIFGVKKIIIIATSIYILSSMVASFSNSAMMLIICRSVQGMSAAPILVNCPALITAIFPANERGRALGINLTSVYLGYAAGPFLGGILTGYVGWRSIFLINIPFNVAVIPLLIYKVRGEWCECKGQKIDLIGWVIFVLSLIVFMYGFSLLPGLIGAILILLGIIGLKFFMSYENSIVSPMFNVKIFKKNRTFILSNVATLINYAAVFAVAFLLNLYLQFIKGFSPKEAGIIMVTQPLVQALLAPLAGRLSDRMPPHLVASMGMAFTCLGLLLCVFFNSDTSLQQIILALVLIGTGVAFFVPPNMNALMSSVASEYYGVASATMSTVISLGQTLSMGITTVVMTIVIGEVVITDKQYPLFLTSARTGFWVFTLLCLGGVFASFYRNNNRLFK